MYGLLAFCTDFPTSRQRVENCPLRDDFRFVTASLAF